MKRWKGESGGSSVRSDLRLVSRLYGQARPYWPHVAGILILDLLAAPLVLLTPVPLAIAVDGVVGGEPLSGILASVIPDSVAQSQHRLLLFAAGAVVGIALVTRLLRLVGSLLKTYTGERVSLELRGRVFRHAERLSLAHHDRAGTADPVYRIQYDAPAIDWVVVNGMTPFVTAGLTLIGMVFVTARLDLQLALVALAVSPFLAVITAVSRRMTRRQWGKVKELESAGLSVVQEVMSGLRVVKAFGQEDRELGRFLRQYEDGVSARMTVSVLQGGFGLLVGLTTAAGTAAVLYVGVSHVLAGVLSLGSLLIILSYVGQIFTPLSTLVTGTTSLQKSLASAERVYDFLALPMDVEERENARPVHRVRGSIEFEDVHFSYDGKRDVLKAVSLSIAEGQRVGIAGATGAGKSTLVGLLNRLYDPSAGRILLDGVDLRDYRLSDLRDQFTVVLQDTVLFSTSIAENIAYAKPGADPREITAAARAANVHDFIEGLPKGYDTLVGDRGMLLSGGERQRIALARAFLKNAPILVLDEPTSSVDMATEAGILDALDRLMEGRTVFMIAHRLGTLEGCEVLLELEQGAVRLIERAISVS